MRKEVCVKFHYRRRPARSRFRHILNIFRGTGGFSRAGLGLPGQEVEVLEPQLPPLAPLYSPSLLLLLLAQRVQAQTFLAPVLTHVRVGVAVLRSGGNYTGQGWTPAPSQHKERWPGAAVLLISCTLDIDFSVSAANSIRSCC